MSEYIATLMELILCWPSPTACSKRARPCDQRAAPLQAQLGGDTQGRQPSESLACNEGVMIVAGSLIIGGSTVLATVIHRRVVHCSYSGNVPPPGCITSDYSMTQRA